MPTLADAAILLDAGVPPVLGTMVSGWVPTINWTVQFKHHPHRNPIDSDHKFVHVLVFF